MAVRPGEILAGKYRVERILGSGGMGYVVAARHLQLDELVAMKFLRAGTHANSEASARFLREAKAAVKLKNEHVAKVFDVGTLESEEPYIVMEYLEGKDLSVISKERGPMSIGEAADFVVQACDALAEAHSLGIIHRDIKLANLFVTRGAAGEPLVKVLDFGVSKTNPFGESEHDMTRSSSMLGSPRFMSPEQMRDPRAVDGRTDIWSLGVCLYRLVAGRAPFDAETLGQLLTSVMHEIPDRINAVRPDVPPAFEQVVSQCLEKDPRARFATVAELAYALAPFCSDPRRALSSAERMTLVQSHGPAPSKSDAGRFSQSVSRPSGPPHLVESGTAAPWAGHPPLAPSGKWPLVAGVAAIFAIAALGGFFLTSRSPALPPPAPPAVAAPSPAPPPTETVAPAPPPAEPPPVIELGNAPTPAPAAKPTVAKGGARKPAPATSAPKRDDGIPSTRD